MILLDVGRVNSGGKASEECLVKKEDLFYQIVENSPSQITFIDVEGRLIYLNKAARDFFGVAEGFQLPTDVDPQFSGIRAVHPEESARLVLEVGIPTAIRNGSWRGEIEVWKKGDTQVAVPVEQVIIAHHDETGKVTHISSTIRDLSEGNRAIHLNNMLLATLEATSDLVGVSTVEGKVEYHNKAWDNYVSNSTTASFKRSDFHPPWVQEQLQAVAIPMAAKNGVWQGEGAVYSKQGKEVPVSQVIVCHYDKHHRPTHFSTIMRDISDVKENHAKMVQTSKMVALGEMSSGVAHEINNPLSIIVGRVSQVKKLLQADVVDKKKIFEFLDKIDATTVRISKIIRGLKNFSRTGENEPFEPIALRQLVEETLDLSQERFKNHGVELRLAEIPDIVIHCRSIQITQVLVNLLNNAFDAVQTLPEKWIRLQCLQTENGLEFRVTDSGSGIPEKVLEKIMVPFFTTKEVGKGTGLGLSISKGIAEDHGGYLTYNPTSKNTEFVLTLPTKKIAIKVA